jgi:hypothetical protein
MSVTQTWIAAILTLALFTYLYKENSVYRVAEHIMVGLAAAHGMVMTWDNYIKSTITTSLLKDGEWSFLIPIAIGLLIYTRYMPKWQWLSRIPMSYWVGYGIGYTLAFTPRQFLMQVIDSFIAMDSLENVVFFICLATSLMYFFFTVSREYPGMNVGATIGRYAIMVSLGASFGNTVQGRISLFLGRLQFLLGDWLHLITFK